MDDKLLTLPWQIQLTLGCGYFAYMIAYGGIKQHHSSADAVFRSIGFGLVASAVLFWMPPYPVWRPLTAAILTISAGAFWRAKGMLWFRSILRGSNVSWSDDTPSAWVTITAERTDLRPSQIAVDIDGGRTIVCDDTTRFTDLPFGPCTFGLDGSIALYVTAERKPDGEWIEITDITEQGRGSKLTYVPASGVKRIEIRYWDPAIERDEAEETGVEVVAPGAG